MPDLPSEPTRPADDGDTRPTDRERLVDEQHYPTTPVQCACGWRQTDPGAGTWVDHMRLAARAPAPPDATQAVRDLISEWRDGCATGHPACDHDADCVGCAADELERRLAAPEPDAARSEVCTSCDRTGRECEDTDGGCCDTCRATGGCSHDRPDPDADTRTVTEWGTLDRWYDDPEPQSYGTTEDRDDAEDYARLDAERFGPHVVVVRREVTEWVEDPPVAADPGTRGSER